MMTVLSHFFAMGGYGWYVWLSYASVLSALFLQWLIPWRQWKNYLRQKESTHE